MTQSSPMDLANMRANGVRSLWVQSNQCRHTTVMNVDHLPGDLTVPSFGPRMVCTKCGTLGADARPNWQERGTWLIFRRSVAFPAPVACGPHPSKKGHARHNRLFSAAARCSKPSKRG